MSTNHIPGFMITAGLLFGSGPAIAGADEAAAGPEPVDDQLQIVVPSEDGIVSGRALAHAIATAAQLDASALDLGSARKGIDLNEPAARLTLQLISVAIPDVSLRIADTDEEDSPALVVSIDVAEMRRKSRAKKRRIRQALSAGDESRFGLGEIAFPPGDPPQSIVILIHGFNAEPQSMTALETFLQQRGRAVASFRYPNDGPLIESAELLDRELKRLHAAHPRQDIILVTHSMGGLVARGAIELPELASTNVARLIMVAPPNHGSDWARIPVDVEGHEAVRLATRGNLSLRHLITDGLNEARSDLKPTSDFLRTLNQCARALHVRYSIIAGTEGVMTQDEFDDLRVQLDDALRSSKGTAVLRPLANGFAAELDEIVIGTGDGVVAVDSARLEGVDDFITLPMNHTSIAGTDAVSDQLFLEIDGRIDP